MKALIFSTLLNLDVDCNTFNRAETNDASDWKKNVCETYFSEYSNVKMRALRHTSKKVIESTEKKIQATQPVAGRMIVKQISMNESSELIQTTTFYAIDAFKEVWIAQKNIQKNEIIVGNDVVKEIKNVGSIIGIEKFPEKNPQGLFIENSLPKGQIIYSRYLSEKPIIEAGKSVNVIFASQYIKLNTKGVALQHGFSTESVIKVRLIDTGKIFLGKIKDNETVTVDI